MSASNTVSTENLEDGLAITDVATRTELQMSLCRSKGQKVLLESYKK